MATAAASELERVLEAASVRDAVERSAFLAAIRELGKDGGDFTAERLQRLLRVEDHFHALLLHDQEDFLRGSLGDARDFALTVQRICLEAANAFQRFLRNRAAWAHAPESPDAMARVTGLALAAIHAFVKWGCFLDESGRAIPWKQMHALYALAEGDGYAERPLVLHASQPGYQPTVQSLYLRTLVLELLHTGNVSKAQVEIADGWLSAWCDACALDREYSSREHAFFVDLASDAGLRPIGKPRFTDTMRFLRADRLKAHVEEVQSALRQGRVYSGLGAGAAFAVEEHVALLARVEKLQRAIGASDQGIEERQPMQDREVDVALGVERVLRKARPAPAASERAEAPAALSMRMLDASPASLSALASDPQFAAARVEAPAVDPDVERWRVYDLSSRGFGLLVDRSAAEAVVLNDLLALRNHESGAWIVGTVVRKQPHRTPGEVLVGVEVLAYRAIPIELRAGEGEASRPALYLPAADGDARHDALLLRAADFRAGSGCDIRAGAGAYRVRPTRILRKGPDWIKARFEVESKR